MKKWAIIAVSAVLCVVALGAYTYSYTSALDVLKPSLTGDPAADATCAAAVAPFIEDGDPQSGKIIGMSLEERQEVATNLQRASEDVRIPEIKSAATALLGGLAMQDAGLFGKIGFAQAYVGMANACTSNGWDAKKAGLW